MFRVALAVVDIATVEVPAVKTPVPFRVRSGVVPFAPSSVIVWLPGDSIPPDSMSRYPAVTAPVSAVVVMASAELIVLNVEAALNAIVPASVSVSAVTPPEEDGLDVNKFVTLVPELVV